MIKFPSIESFAHIFRDIVGGLEVRPKIKLHGTNGGIWIKDGEVIAQSRNNLLINSDNAGFAAFVKSQEKLWAKVSQVECVIFGEWAGPGIQSIDAVTKIPKRQFFIFACYMPDVNHIVTDPEVLKEIIGVDLQDVRVLPWAGQAVKIDYTNAGVFSETANAIVEEIGEMDPYIKETFGVEGPGEGLVYMPEHGCNMEFFCRNTFKAKTEAHRVKRSSKAVTVKIDIPKDVVDFAKMFVTEARCQQGLIEGCGGDRSPQRTGEFINWMCADIYKESKVELEAMGYEWGKLAKFVIPDIRA